MAIWPFLFEDRNQGSHLWKAHGVHPQEINGLVYGNSISRNLLPFETSFMEDHILFIKLSDSFRKYLDWKLGNLSSLGILYADEIHLYDPEAELRILPSVEAVFHSPRTYMTLEGIHYYANSRDEEYQLSNQYASSISFYRNSSKFDELDGRIKRDYSPYFHNFLGLGLRNCSLYSGSFIEFTSLDEDWLTQVTLILSTLSLWHYNHFLINNQSHQNRLELSDRNPHNISIQAYRILNYPLTLHNCDAHAYYSYVLFVISNITEFNTNSLTIQFISGKSSLILSFYKDNIKYLSCYVYVVSRFGPAAYSEGLVANGTLQRLRHKIPITSSIHISEHNCNIYYLEDTLNTSSCELNINLSDRINCVEDNCWNIEKWQWNPQWNTLNNFYSGH